MTLWASSPGNVSQGTSARVAGTIAAGEAAAATGQHRVPESEKADNAGEDDDRTADVVVEGPRTGGEGRAPDQHGDHDPAEDRFGLGGGGRSRHGSTIGPCPAAADAAAPTAQKKGPRNGPDPRGAGNLNRFRERLDGRLSRRGQEGLVGPRGAAIPPIGSTHHCRGAAWRTPRQPQSWGESRGAIFRGQGLFHRGHKESTSSRKTPEIPRFHGGSPTGPTIGWQGGAVWGESGMLSRRSRGGRSPSAPPPQAPTG